MKSKKIKRRIEIVLSALFIIAVGLFFYFSYGNKAVTAKADGTIAADDFYMDGTMMLSIPQTETDSIRCALPYYMGTNVESMLQEVIVLDKNSKEIDDATMMFYQMSLQTKTWPLFVGQDNCSLVGTRDIFLFRSETLPTGNYFGSVMSFPEYFENSYDFCKLGVKETKENNYYRAGWDGSIPDYSKDYYYFVAVVRSYYSIISGREAKLEGYYVEKVCTNYSKRSYKYVAEKVLENQVDDLTEMQVKYFRRIAGIDISTDNFEVIINYRELEKINALKPSKTSKIIRVDSLRVLDKEYVFWSAMKIMGKKYISDFNVVQRELAQGGSGAGLKNDGFLIDERVWLQAKDYTYTFDSTTNKGTIDINYEKFTASAFPIVVTNNKEEDNLTAFLYSAQITIAGGVTTITFDTSNLETRLCNNYGWEFYNSDFDNFLIENPYETTGEVSITKNYTTDEDGQNHVTSLTITTSDENLLVDCDVRLEVSIIPPVECTVTVSYETLSIVDGNLSDTATETALEGKVWSNKLKALTYNEFLNGSESKGFPACADLIKNALKVNGLDNIAYLTPYDKQVKVSMENATARITVLYKYRAVFCINDNMASETYFMSVYNDSSLDYSGVEFLKDFDGYRAKDIACENKSLAEIKRNAERPDNMKKAIVRVNCTINEKIVIPLYVTYTNEYEVKVGHLENIAAMGENGEGTLSGLAQRVVTEKTITVDFFEDIYTPTEEELKNFFGLSDLRVIGKFGMPDLEKTTVKFEDDIYEIELEYACAAIKVQESDGNYVEVKVPMSRYSDWTASFGEDWSVLALNTTQKVVFTDTVTIKREEVYGYFFVSVFDEKVTSVNDLFAKFSKDGCKTFFQSTKVNGSGFYKFMRDNPALLPAVGGTVGLLVGRPIAGAAAGAGAYYGVMSIAEFANDENRTYYSYFSFIDGTSELPYLSRAGALNVGDNDPAIKNAMEELLNNLKDWFGGSEVAKILKKGLAVVAMVIIGIVLLRVTLWAGGSIIRSARKIKAESGKSKSSSEKQTKRIKK